MAAVSGSNGLDNASLQSAQQRGVVPPVGSAVSDVAQAALEAGRRAPLMCRPRQRIEGRYVPAPAPQPKPPTFLLSAQGRVLREGESDDDVGSTRTTPYSEEPRQVAVGIRTPSPAASTPRHSAAETPSAPATPQPQRRPRVMVDSPAPAKDSRRLVGVGERLSRVGIPRSAPLGVRLSVGDRQGSSPAAEDAASDRTGT